MISREPGNDQTGKVRLEPLGPNRDPVPLRGAVPPHEAAVAWFEGPIYRFINRQNEASMRRAAEWLTEHPEYRADFVAT